MIDKLYSKYFQKSKSFLYPALGIKRNSFFAPKATYLSIEGIIPVEDMKLICVYEADDSEKFKAFEESMLLTNPIFSKKLVLNNTNLYVFDLEIYKDDWVYFMIGKYSKLSNLLKRIIKNYFGQSSVEYKYIESYLYPDKYFEAYSKLLEIDVDTLKKIGELCDPCDLGKETLKINKEKFESLV
jgi:hypothetical protein